MVNKFKVGDLVYVNKDKAKVWFNLGKHSNENLGIVTEVKEGTASTAPGTWYKIFLFYLKKQNNQSFYWWEGHLTLAINNENDNT